MVKNSVQTHSKSKRWHSHWKCFSISLFVVLLVFYMIGFKPLASFLGWGTTIRLVGGIQDGEVLQKSPLPKTEIKITGKVGWKACQILWAFADGDGTVRADQWRELDAHPFFFFGGSIQLEAGWNEIYLRSRDSRNGSRSFTPLSVGVGEVFIVAGQSNAAGACQTLFSPFSEQVRLGVIDDKSGVLRWRKASDPQVANAGGSVWPLVGDALQKRLQVPIGFVNIAQGSSTIDEWMPCTANFKKLVEVAKQLGPSGFRAVLWHQGESDVGRISGIAYSVKLRAIIAEFQKETSSANPWMVANASYSRGASPEACDSIRKGQQELWADRLTLKGPDTDIIGANGRESSDGVHFNESGTQRAAHLWIEALVQAFYRKGTNSQASEPVILKSPASAKKAGTLLPDWISRGL